MATPDVPPGTGRLPFQLRKVGATGRLALAGETVLGWVHVDRLELEVPDAATAGFDADAPAERYQRRRTQLIVASVRVDQRALEARVVAAAPALALQGVAAMTARLADGHVSVTARVADGLAAADLSFRVLVAPSGLGLRIVAGDVRVHGYLPTPGPLLAHRILVTVLDAVEPRLDAAAELDQVAPQVRGLCDIELEPLPALLWRLLPARGWRLPGTTGLALVAARISRAGLVASYAPSAAGGPRDEVASADAAAIVLAHDAMHSADQALRKGQLDDAMRGYRALLAAGGPDQPVLLARILAGAAARPTWFVDGLELARQALARWPDYAPAHATLASIAIAKGDSRDAAAHLGLLAEACGEVGDDDAAALAALAAARLLRVIDPRAATAMYEQALTFHPGHAEAVDALIERYTEEARWQDLVRLHRARLGSTTDRSRAVRDHLRLAEVLSGRLADRRGARVELERARDLASDDPTIHQAMADLAEAAGEDAEAAAALAEVARLAHERHDRHGEAHACARRAQLLDRAGDDAGADAAWATALDLAPDDLAVMRGAARARARRGAPASAAALWRRVLHHDLPAADAAEASLELARVLGELGDLDGARAALADAARGPIETAADAHQLLAELLWRGDVGDPRAAAGELDAAIAALITAAEQAFALPDGRGDAGERMLGRAAVLAVERARLLDGVGDREAALGDLQRAHKLAQVRAPDVARDAARALLDRTGDDAAAQRGWIDAVLATRPPDAERARLLVRRARQRWAEAPPAEDEALADLSEALAIAAGDAEVDDATHADALAAQAEILLGKGDRAGSARARAARARLIRGGLDRAHAEIDAATAWLDADEPAAALPHASRAVRDLADDASPAMYRRALLTLADAAWRQRAWAELALAIGALLEDADAMHAAERAILRYRGAVAAEKLGDPARARRELDDVLGDADTPAELRAHAHRLRAELCERAGDHLQAARSLEAFASDPTTGMSASVRADAWYRAAELYRRAGGEAMRGDAGAPAAGDPHLDDAARCLEGALRLVEDHLPALDSLELVERAMGNLERVAVILGRKIAASARRPPRQKALLARLATLQLELGRPEVALEAYRRALELDPDDRTALRFVADHARHHDRGVSATTYERLTGPLPGDADDEPGAVTAARAAAAASLAALVATARDGAPADASWAETWLPRARAAVEAALPLAPADDELRRAAEAIRGEGRGPLGPPAGAPAQVRVAALQRQAGDARVHGRLDHAAAHLAAAVELEPADPELLRDLAEVLSEQGDWSGYAETLDRLAASTGEARNNLGPRRAEVLLELADVCYDRLGDVPRARAAMRAAAEAHGPGARRDATLRLLASEAFSRGEFAEALSAFESLAPARRSGSDRVAMATAHHRLGRDGAAITMLDEARATGRISDEGAMLLFALHTERKRKAELAARLEHAAASAPPSEARARLYEALTLYRDQVSDPDATARVAARLETLGTPDVTAVVPVPPATARAAAYVAASGSAAVAAAAAAAAAVATSTAPPRTGAFGAAAGSAVAAASVAATASDASAAAEAARRAYGSTGGGRVVDDDWSTPTIDLAADFAEITAAAQRIAAAPSRAEELERDAEAAAARGEREAAADLLADALAARVAAGAGQAEVLGALGNLESVATPDVVLRAQFNASARAPVDVAVLLLRRAAITAERDLLDDVIAADALARAHSLARTDAAVLDELTAVLTRTGDLVRLADACEQTARAATGRVAARAWHQLGLVQRDAFNDPRRSAEHLAAAHREDPDFAPTWLPLANALAADDDLAGARALYERALRDADLTEDERLWVITRLDALGHDPHVVSGELGARPIDEHRESSGVGTPEASPLGRGQGPRGIDDRTTDVVDTDQVMAAVAQSLTDMISAVAAGMTEAMTAAVTGELPPAPGPAATLAALDADADDDDAQARITEPMAVVAAEDVLSAESTGELPALSAVTAPHAVVVIPPLEDAGEGPLPIAQRITQPLPAMFGDDEVPVEVVTTPRPRTVPPPPPGARRVTVAPPPWVPTATSDAPTQPLEAPPAAPDHAALEDIYERNGDWDALTELLGQRIVAATDDATRAALWYRRATLYRDVLHREAETYRCLREAHACAPADPEIAHALRAVAMARAEWALAAELIYREIAAAPSDRDRGALHLELAMIFDEKLLEPAQAQRNFEQALALDPEIPAAPRPLATIYERAHRDADAAAMWRRAADHAKPADRAGLQIRAAQAAARAGDVAAARAAATDALAAADAVGDAEAARDARAELARHAPALERAERDLPQSAAGSADERVVALEAALAAAQARGDLPAADRHADALYELDPTNGLAFRHLAAAAEDALDWPALTSLLSSRASTIVTDPSERATTWFELGRVHDQRRRDPIAAAAAYDRALEAVPEHPAALDARAALAFAAHDWDKADALYARIVPAKSALSREVLLMRRVSIAETRGRFADALAIASEAAASEGASREAFTAAIKLGLRIGDHAAAATAARAALELMPPEDPVALADAKVELGELLHLAGDHAGAAAVFEQVLDDDPKHHRALAALVELHQRLGQPAAAAKVLRTLTGLADQAGRKAELVWRLGELHLKTGDLDGADDEFLRASDLDPGHQPTLRRLIDVYWRADDPPLLLDVCTDLHQQGQLLVELTDRLTLARALITAAMSAALNLAAGISTHLGADAPALVARALVELKPDRKELTLADASAGLRELARKGQGPKVLAIADALADLPDDTGDDAATALTG